MSVKLSPLGNRVTKAVVIVGERKGELRGLRLCPPPPIMHELFLNIDSTGRGGSTIARGFSAMGH